MEQQANTVWTTGYLPNGLKASFTFVISNPMNAFAEATAYLDKLLADGLQMREPGLEAGEQSYTVTHIARRTQNNKKKDGTTSTCPLIDIYHDDLAFSSLKTWLNTPDEIADFERVTGLKLETIKTFPGTAAIKRGESADADAFVYRLPQSIKAIWKLNPDYVEGSTSQQKRQFIRWELAGNGVISHEKAVSSVSTAENFERPKKVAFAVESAFTRLSSTGRKYYVLAGEQYEAITFDPKKIGEDFAAKLNDQLAPVGDMTAIGLLQSKDGKSWYDLQDILVPF